MSKETKESRERYAEQQLASEWNYKFKDAMVEKAPYTKRWTQYWDAYRGDYFKNEAKPEYKSDLVSNYIFSIIETIRPIMLDNDPKFQSMPRQPEGMAFSSDLQEAFLYEWDREKMSTKLYRELITSLVTGTAVFFLPWDAESKNVKAIPVNPFNLFPDPLATSVEDSEYLIYASYHNVNKLKRSFPDKAKLLSGGQVNYGELVHDNNKNSRLDNQVLVLEVYTRDYENWDEKGKIKYPNGRVLTICPELGIVLSDRAMPYKDGEFPFTLIKDYDIPGKFWGEGEVAQLLSPQKHMNELNNAIIDNAKMTANMPWIVDKNAGVKQGGITSRPGLIIRKNPGSEVRRDQPPGMPAYVVNAVETYKSDMEQISGIFDTLKGNSETGVYTAQGILALQEAGQARVRLKVKLMEDSLSRLATLWFSRMKQYWKDGRWVRITRSDGETDLKRLSGEAFDYEYDIKITAGSTMPVNRGAMLDLMIRLAQTAMPDGQPLVDREAVIQYLPEEVKSALLRRMGQNTLQVEQQIQELGQALQQMSEQMQQLMQEIQSNDGETMSVIEELAGGMEAINKKILQLQDNHARIVEDKKREDERNQIKTQAYNSGYADAERILSDLGAENVQQDAGLPEELLSGIETLTDDQLALLISQNPELADLI